MTNEGYRVLIIEDSDPFVRTVRTLLSEGMFQGCAVSASSLEEAIAVLETEEFDALLLDLNLGDSSGVATLDAVVAVAPKTPTVVLTGTYFDRPLDLLRRGAEDFIAKDEVTAPWLVRALVFAISRAKLRRGEAPPRPQFTNQNFVGRGPHARHAIFDGDSVEFSNAVGRFDDVVQTAVENRVLTQGRDTKNQVRELALDLGQRGAGPRDVMEIYLRAMSAKSESTPIARARAVAKEGRLTLLEVMGELVDFYRRDRSTG